MATIVIHAGMPKAGSSAVQTWLRRRRDELARRDVTIVVAQADGEEVVVRPFAGGPINSGIVVRRILESNDEAYAARVVGQFVGGLEDLAREGGTIIATSEALAHPFWLAKKEFLEALDRLAASHDVRVGYYVRPQHTALEASWRQWGFRMGLSPAEYIRRRSDRLDFAATIDIVSSLAPNVDFRVRPFRRDLLDGGDVVTDFAHCVLGLDDVPVIEEQDFNLGMSLELVNLLARAPEGLLGRTEHDNRRFDVLKRIFAGIDAPATPSVERGRDVLQAWAHRRFESGNQVLIQRCGWPTDHFVPSPTAGEVELDRLDTLWQPAASEAELAAIFCLIDRYFEQDGGAQ